MYKNSIALNSAAHKEYSLKPVSSFEFARELNSCVIVGQEFLEAAKQYPIVFTVAENGQLNPLALLGIHNNLYLGADGLWEAEAYIPAYIRRYPFILSQGSAESDLLTVCIDSAYEGFGTDGDKRLFTDEGESTPFLNEIVEFTRLFHNQSLITREFLTQLQELDILKSIDASITLANDGGVFTIRDLKMVDEEALLKLADDKLADMVRKGYLAWIYAHLGSLTNFSRIVSRASHVAAAQ